MHSRHEKTSVALWSLLAAAGMTAGKLLVGVLTNSLGIIAEALHSGLDLLATGMTLWAVRLSEKPPDRNHTYGHGKFENLSALGQTLLLFITAGWVVYEAVVRLFFREGVEIQPSVWAFLVVLASIGVDFWRSRALKRVADKYHSQALEADALHFSTDIWSSLVVLVGLTGVLLGQRWGLERLEKLDAVAALLVSVLVIYVSLRLGLRSVAVLSDQASEELVDRIAAAGRVEGVLDVKNVRVRQSGAGVFADLTAVIPRDLNMEAAHELVGKVIAAVRQAVPHVDVVVHPEPTARLEEDRVTTIRVLAKRHGLEAHDLHTIHQEDGRQTLELHVELDPAINLRQAHERASRLEEDMKSRFSDIGEVITHLEPSSASQPAESLQGDRPAVEQVIADFLASVGAAGHAHAFRFQRIGLGLALSFHIHLDGELPIHEAHEISRGLERQLRREFPALHRVTIHVEPHPERDSE
ncbi:MAG: cation-efflux pump [Thermogutta sp.]